MKTVELYKHNKTTYDNITRIFETGNRCAVVQPTGSGKSFLIFKLAQDNPDKKIVVFEPNRYIISRVSMQSKEYGITNIEFFTYQKLIRMTDDEIGNINADYIFLDELHRTGAKEWGRCTNTLFEMFPNTKFLGLTATPQRTDGVNIVDDFGAELACNITLGDAIVQGILPTPTYISALYTFDDEVAKVEQKINECTNSEEEKADMRKQLAIAKHNLESSCGVSEILKKHIPSKVGKYIVFCQNIAHLDSIRPVVLDWFKAAGYEVIDYVVHSKNMESDKQFKSFDNDNNNTIRLLFCVSMLNEGVHLDNISGVIMLRPTTSNIVYFQQLGRAIDAASSETPFIFDLVNNSDCVGYSSLFEEIEITVERNKAEDSESCGFDINDFHIYDYISDCVSVLTEIKKRCVDEFDYRLKQLDEYKAKWGHCCVMEKEAKEWNGLSSWAISQRQMMNRKEISQNRLNILNQYNFVWDIERWKFDIFIVHIKQYLNNGNCFPIASTYICEDGYRLGMKAIRIIHDNINGELRKDFKEDLIALGVSFKNTYRDERWYKFYNVISEYIDVVGESVIEQTQYKGYKIGSWLYRNKRMYQKGELPQEKAELLKNIIYLASSKNDEKWDNNFLILKRYILEHQGINCLTSHTVYNGTNIGGWYNAQFVLYRQGKLNEYRVRKLESLGGDLLKSKRDKSWDMFLNILFECKKNNIQINQKTFYNGVKVGMNLTAYRRRYKQGKLPEERYQQLLSLGIDLAKKGSYMADLT